MTSAVTRTPLAQLLAQRIRASGPITFADYMAACLYHPEFGYYATGKNRQNDDYYTSPAMHPIFGKLLAFQLHEMWSLLEYPQPFFLVEVATGDGLLASHILDFCAGYFHSFYQALRYVAVETSAPRREAAALRLQRHLDEGRAELQADMPGEIPSGCIFSNELLDAFPVHILERRGACLFEVFVDCDAEGNFAEKLEEASTPDISEYFAAQKIKFANGQRAEAGLAAGRWMEESGARLKRGFILTVDYGHEAAELYDARHMRGTLLAYRRHRASEDFFATPGEQDLTAHVNFTAVDIFGRRSGLQRTGLAFQTNFLLALARRFGVDNLGGPNLSHAERMRERLKFKTLVYPEGMGETFRVMIQHKGISAPRLTGLLPL